MNYIKLINAFYDRLETNPLSTSAIALWHALVHVNNKAGWLVEFSVAASVLCVKTGLSERTITNARNDLKMKGFIDFRSRKGNRSAVYKIYDLSENITHNISHKEEVSEINADKTSCNVSDSLSDNVSCNVSALYKLNETKQNETNTAADNTRTQENYFDTYMICFAHQPSALQIQEINSFIDQDGLSVEVICDAFKKAAENGYKYNYARGILNSWAKKGIKSLSDVKREQESYELSRKTARRKPVRSEKLPDWFVQQKESQQTQSVADQDDDFDYEAEKQRLLEKYQEA